MYYNIMHYALKGLQNSELERPWSDSREYY